MGDLESKKTEAWTVYIVDTLDYGQEIVEDILHRMSI